MRKFRHQALDYFLARPLPTWGGDLSGIDFDNIYYYIKPTEKQVDKWEDLPADIKDTWDKLGIPAAEKEKFLAGVGAQYESEVVYHKLQEHLTKQGVIFLDMDSGLREHEELVKQYFGTIIPSNDNKFAALNTAVWSGGSFIYVPPGVKIELPLQAYFRINAENMGQFERTLILVDEGAYVHYVEGCTAPIYSSDSLHSRGRRDRRQEGRPLPLHDDPELVEQRLQPRHQARRRLRGRDDGVGRREPRLEADDEVPGDLADGRARARRGAVDRVRRQRASTRTRAARCVHVAPNTTSVITSKSISKNGGRAGYRGLLEVAKGATNVEVEGRLRRADPRRGLALRHLPVHPDRRERGRHRPRGDRLEDRRGAALLPDVARPLRGRGDRR